MNVFGTVKLHFIPNFFIRCLASEGETEKLREKTTELRRKLDDTQAALHEMGRENQSLQVRIELWL